MQTREIVEGDVYVQAAADGVEVTLSDGVGPPLVATAAGGEGARFERLPVGRYWIGIGSDVGMKRAGTLDVKPLADPVRVALAREVEGLAKEVSDLERAIQFQTVDSNAGETRLRSTLTALRKQRSNAEARLADYDRQVAGEAPCR